MSEVVRRKRVSKAPRNTTKAEALAVAEKLPAAATAATVRAKHFSGAHVELAHLSSLAPSDIAKAPHGTTKDESAKFAQALGQKQVSARQRRSEFTAGAAVAESLVRPIDDGAEDANPVAPAPATPSRSRAPSPDVPRGAKAIPRCTTAQESRKWAENVERQMVSPAAAKQAFALRSDGVAPTMLVGASRVPLWGAVVV